MTNLDKVKLTATDPKDFSEGGGDHRKSVLASTALIVVLLISTEPDPAVFGVSISITKLWLLLFLGHLYFFIMWRVTGTIEADRDERFWNLRGLWKQATLGGTTGFPGKKIAQLFFIRALPILAFIVGFFGALYGLYTAAFG